MSEFAGQGLERYKRQIMLDGFGMEGQERLKNACVLIAGAGGLGSVVSIYLAVAGVGRIRLLDNDKVELSNLNRQVLYWEDNIGGYKIDSAVDKLRRLNPTVQVRGLVVSITEENAKDLMKGCDVVVDGMDNFTTRFILNKACFKANIPFVHAAIYGFEGRLMTIIPGRTACLQCLYPSPPPEIGPFPVLGAIPGCLACLQAMETIKLITGLGKTTNGNLIVIDGEFMRFEVLKVRPNSDCPVCGKAERGAT